MKKYVKNHHLMLAHVGPQYMTLLWPCSYPTSKPMRWKTTWRNITWCWRMSGHNILLYYDPVLIPPVNPSDGGPRVWPNNCSGQDISLPYKDRFKIITLFSRQMTLCQFHKLRHFSSSQVFFLSHQAKPEHISWKLRLSTF